MYRHSLTYVRVTAHGPLTEEPLCKSDLKQIRNDISEWHYIWKRGGCNKIWVCSEFKCSAATSCVCISGLLLRGRIFLSWRDVDLMD